MTLAAWYVLVSRVRTLGSLRLLQFDSAGLASLKGLKHDEYLAAWTRGYDKDGRWSDELAVAAFRKVRHLRQSEKQKRADAKKKANKAAGATKVAPSARKRAAPAVPSETAAAAPAGKKRNGAAAAPAGKKKNGPAAASAGKKRK